MQLKEAEQFHNTNDEKKQRIKDAEQCPKLGMK